MVKNFFKIRFAVFFGYNGSKYYGLQKIGGRTDLNTIEKTLEKALFDTNLISEKNFDHLNKIGWARGSRTDKGVHASLNTIKCKLNVNKELILKENQNQNFLEKINKVDFRDMLNIKQLVKDINVNLPEEIRIFSLKYVTNSFAPKNKASSRKYEYLLPLSILKNKDDFLSEDQILQKLKNCLRVFRGTNNFHNYSKKTNFSDNNSIRLIFDTDADFFEDFKVIQKKEKYIKIKIEGQAFLYNQIRKMIGMIIFIFKNNLDEIFINKSFEEKKYNILLAPSHGLLLDRIIFKYYNENKKNLKVKLELDEEEENNVEKFKKEFIYNYIIEKNEEDNIFDKWYDNELQYIEDINNL